MHKGKFLIVGALSALGLAGTATAGEEWRQVAFNCESGQSLDVSLKTSGGAARVKTGDKPQVRLVARPAKEGDRYADSRHELRISGQEATWQVGDRSPVKCTAAEGATLAESTK